MKKKLGLQCLFASFLIYGFVFALPFVDLPYKWGIGLGLYGLSYLFFFAAAGLLGSELYQYLPWNKKEPPSSSSE